MSHSVTFLHLADLHLGLRISKLEKAADKIREARFVALDNALKIAAEKEVQFIIIAGDLFDDNEISLNDIRRTYNNLQRKPFKVFILPGNHDPYRPGSIWYRQPWTNWESSSIHLLTEKKPIVAMEKVAIFPCPVTKKSSFTDPTEWIETDNIKQEMIRIGVAHGSVMDRNYLHLPKDDHPIALNAPEKKGLDYLALGHWHTTKIYRDRENITRMAYAGTHEQMSWGNPQFSTGWEAYSPEPEREEFLGGSVGKALLVRINKYQDGSEVKIQEEKVGHFLWEWQAQEGIDDQKLERLFSELSKRENTERRLLHLDLKGMLSPESLLRLPELEDMLNRYCYCELNKENLHIKPDDRDLETAFGYGVMKQIFLKLKELREKAPENEESKVVELAMITLYQLAKEANR